MAFWGLVLEPKKSYTQRGVEQPFHISMAALDLQNCDPNEQSVSVVCRKRDSDFILCSLSKKQGIFNVPLNLDFELGGEINFHVLGNCTVHLTGYIIEDMEFDDDDDSSLDEEEEDEDNGAILKNTKKLLEAASKRKSETTAQNKSKKTKLVATEDDEDDDDDDEEESDFDVEEEESLDEGEEEEDSDDDDDDDDDDEDDESGEAKEALKKLQANLEKKQGKQNNAGAKAEQNAKQGKKDKKQANSPQPNKPANGAQPQSNGVAKRVVKGGVQVEDLVVGSGPPAKDGKQISVFYAGRLKQNNKQFDACQSGQGFKFRLGKGEVIKGWDVGIAGMKVGGKRRLTIPAQMGYGSKGAGKTIPPNSVLVFDVELKNVK